MNATLLDIQRVNESEIQIDATYNLDDQFVKKETFVFSHQRCSPLVIYFKFYTTQPDPVPRKLTRHL